MNRRSARDLYFVPVQTTRGTRPAYAPLGPHMRPTCALHVTYLKLSEEALDVPNLFGNGLLIVNNTFTHVPLSMHELHSRR